MGTIAMRSGKDTAPLSLPYESFERLPPARKRELFFTHKLIVLKSGKPLSRGRIKNSLRSFGALYKNPAGENFFVDGDPETMRVSSNRSRERISGLFHNFSLNWHQDFSHTPGDFHGSALYNKRNGHKADFHFIDTEKAFRALPKRLYEKHKSARLGHCAQAGAMQKAFLTNLTKAEQRLLQIKKLNIRGYFSPSCLNGEIKRPLFPAHPVTGKRSIYLSAATAIFRSIGEKDFEEMLSRCLPYRKRLVYEDFDLLLFDNLSMMHRRDAFSGDRELWRFQFDYSQALEKAGAGKKRLKAAAGVKALSGPPGGRAANPAFINKFINIPKILRLKL